MADQSIQNTVQDLHRQAAGSAGDAGGTSGAGDGGTDGRSGGVGGGPVATSDRGSANVSQALGWINRSIHEKDVMKRAAEIGMPYIDVAHQPINPDLLTLITKDEAVKAGTMPFMRIGKHLRVAVVNPANPETVAVMRRWAETGEGAVAPGLDVEMNLCSVEGLSEAVKVFDAQQTVVKQELVTTMEDKSRAAFEKEIALLADLKTKVETVTSEEALNLIEVGAMKTGASDMHFEPSEQLARVRFRIDGVLHHVFDLKKEVFANVIGQLKYKCKMKLNITNIPQDGRYSFELNSRKIDVRVSAIPTQYGESFVCRLLDSGKSFLSFEEMGFQSGNLEKMNKLPSLSHGMILVTGPTGSGKTTTLYSLLTRFNTPEAKVITLEDPVEYHLDGISQSQIDESHGYGFADGLRTILRQDPDVVMIGEIRDLETASVAAQAAMTGHVMLSTLHTNGAVESVARLVNMGLPEFIAAPSLHTIIAQRLVRRLCVCAEKRPMTEDEKAKFVADLEKIKIVIPDLGITLPLEMLSPKGCEICSNTGYRGRVVIAEMIGIDTELQELILAKASAPKLYEAARKKGMITMQEDGILKVLQGITTMEEVFAATNVVV